MPPSIPRWLDVQYIGETGGVALPGRPRSARYTRGTGNAETASDLHGVHVSPNSDTATVAVRRLLKVTEAQIEALAELLVDCVEGGASVGFMHPLPVEKARAFWRRVADRVARGERALLIAEDSTGVIGTVHMVLEQPDNQQHRADLSKMLVHRRARRRGAGAALIVGAEALARECGRSLLVLDTVTGSDAERLYARLGWQRAGEIPGFALLPHGGLCPTTYYYRALES